MKYTEILEDITIAKNVIKDSKLDLVTKGNELLCEVYCLPSFHWQAFYLRVYGGEHYTLQWAKPLVRDHRGLVTVSTTFSAAIKAKDHIGFSGSIYCGLKEVPKHSQAIATLCSLLPEVSEILDQSMICIDGVTTLIIHHKSPTPATLCFRDADRISKNTYTAEEKQFLDDLHLHIEKEIGNLLSRQH